MSLIEKAARRLQELQRAGAVLPEDWSSKSPADGMGPKHHERVPIPEALMRKAETSQSDPSGFATAGSSEHAVPGTGQASAVPPIANRAAGAAQGPRRRVNLDFVRLAQLSFVTPLDPQSTTAQEFRVIKRPVIRNASGKSDPKIRNGNLVAVTSSLPSEGKTFVAANLAISIAMEVDRTVMLVDGDVAHPSLPAVLGIPTAPGLLDLLVRDDLDVDDVLLQTNLDGLTVMPAGHRDRRATELLASEKMGRLLQEMSQRFPDRIIIFDSPPLLPTTEAPVLAAQMGQVIMVVAADATSKNAVRQALGLIERCEVVMMLLNKAAKSRVGTYYGYYADDDPK